MATITENLQIIKDSTMAIKQAILNKGGEIGDLTTYADAITNLPSREVKKNAVTFYDYDGTIRYSYTAAEFLALTEMPSLPTQKGLICQEWNWSYEDATEHVAEYGVLDVGATYITDDGKTRLYIKIAAEGRMTVPLYFSQTVSNGVTIDWGDGSSTQTLSGTRYVNTSHTYANIGDYCITLEVTSGTMGLGHNSYNYCVMGSIADNGRVYCNMLQKVEIGSSVNSIGSYPFSNCNSLSSIVIPKSVNSIGSGAFQGCYSLSSTIIPYSVTSIETNAFSLCSVLSLIVIPNSVRTLRNAAIQYCTSLTSIVIPNSVASIGSGVFQGCSALSSILITNSVASLGNYVFNSCYSLRSIVIPNLIQTLGKTMFSYCISLTLVVIPQSVTTIGSNAFDRCCGMAFYDFSNHTVVPTLENINAFTSISYDCKIIVPDGLYDRWIAATNWSAYETYIIKKSEWDNLKQGGSL